MPKLSAKEFATKKFELLIDRYIKGYAFRQYPNNDANSAEEYRLKIENKVKEDIKCMSDSEFEDSYGYVCY